MRADEISVPNWSVIVAVYLSFLDGTPNALPTKT